MIQLPIHKDSHVLRSWMIQLYKLINWMKDSVIKSVKSNHSDPPIDSKATETFKAQKDSKDIIKIVHVISVF